LPCPCGSGKKFKKCCLGSFPSGDAASLAGVSTKSVGSSQPAEASSDFDPQLVEEARRCDECVDWLTHCEAECCCGFRVWLRPDSDVIRERGEVRLRKRTIDPDMLRYYELHGARYDGDSLVLPEACCDFHADGRLEVQMRCSALQQDYLCSLHPSGKPRMCQDFTWETAKSGRCWLTPRCLYGYKLEGVEDRQ
jgi:hypothetical protein